MNADTSAKRSHFDPAQRRGRIPMPAQSPTSPRRSPPRPANRRPARSTAAANEFGRRRVRVFGEVRSSCGRSFCKRGPARPGRRARFRRPARRARPTISHCHHFWRLSNCASCTCCRLRRGVGERRGLHQPAAPLLERFSADGGGFAFQRVEVDGEVLRLVGSGECVDAGFVRRV